MTGRCPVFALRQSPDWPGMAEDYAAGRAVAPDRYMPPASVRYFPANIPACIEAWNASYSVDFFTCRAQLRRIARATLDAVAGAVVLPADDLPARLPEGDFRVFFLDDDDWFAPDTAARIAAVAEEDISVFPLPRLDAPVFMFCRRPPGPGTAVGRPVRFALRLHTNNYALHPRLCTAALLPEFADHHTASETAARLSLSEAYYEPLLSATNKSPASASVIEHLPANPAEFRQRVERFVAALRQLSLPSCAAWMEQPVHETACLFERALG